jgi:voltage-gated sodium channel
MSPIVRIANDVINHKIFKGLILSLILLTAIIVGIETYPAIASKHHNLLVFLDNLVVYSFTIEIILKIIAFGKRPWDFFRDPWNVFDFTIVAICLIPSIDTHFVAVLRIFRILRILRIITFFPKLRLLIGTLLKSIPSMGYVVMLLSILFYVYAILGIFLFGAADPVHFGDLHHAMVTLFKVLTLEGWTDIMNTHLYGNEVTAQSEIRTIGPFFYFASFILIGAMIIMNLFIGVIMKSMEESQNELNQEIKEIKTNSETSDEIYSSIISKLDELRNEISSLKEAKK